jgi:hypothetical protein
MYGVGSTDSEWDQLEFDGERADKELSQAKARKAEADGRAVLAKLADADQIDLDAVFPWPTTAGNRSLTDDEKFAMWVRCSLVAGKPLPFWPVPDPDQEV